MVKPLNINSTTPVSVCLKELFSRALHVKFKKNALIYEVSSKIDATSGATNSDVAGGQVFGFDTSKTSHHGLIRIRDKSTRILSDTASVQDAGDRPPFDAFDWRTIIAFRFPMDLNVSEVSGYIPGMGWISIDLTNRRFWSPAPIDWEGIKEFNDLKHRLAQVQYERNEVKKARDNGKKRKFMEGVTCVEGFWNNRSFVFEKKSGHTEKLFDLSTGEEIKKIRHIQPQKEISLTADFEITRINVPNPMCAEDVANLAARFEVLGEVERHLCKVVREIELGLIEDYMIGINTDTLDDINGAAIFYGGADYTISIGDDYSYDYPDGTAERWKAGELLMRTVETNAQWRAREMVRIIPKDSTHILPSEELV